MTWYGFALFEGNPVGPEPFAEEVVVSTDADDRVTAGARLELVARSLADQVTIETGLDVRFVRIDDVQVAELGARLWTQNLLDAPSEIGPRREISSPTWAHAARHARVLADFETSLHGRVPETVLIEGRSWFWFSYRDGHSVLAVAATYRDAIPCPPDVLTGWQGGIGRIPGREPGPCRGGDDVRAAVMDHVTRARSRGKTAPWKR